MSFPAPARAPARAPVAIPSPSPTSSAPSAFVETVNRFGFQLLQLYLSSATSPAPPNNAHSPQTPVFRGTGLCALNIYHCLILVATGSGSKTLEAFAQTLGFGSSSPATAAVAVAAGQAEKADAGAQQQQLNEAVKQALQLDGWAKKGSGDGGGGGAELSSASSAWHRAGLVLQPEWVERVRGEFGSEVGRAEVRAINDFIERETRGMFKNLVTEGHLRTVQVMLITCLYFKAMWAQPFEKEKSVQDAEFSTFEGRRQRCTMMRKVEAVEYWEHDRMQVCVLPYRSGTGAGTGSGAGAKSSASGESTASPGPVWKAALVLPKERGVSAMQEIIATLATTPSAVTALIGGPSPNKRRGPLSKLDLRLPRFKQNYHLDLAEGLAALGLSPAFEPSADFSPMCGKEPLQISGVTHDLVIEVNEEGTEMAAVTIVTTRGRAIVPKIPEMKLDRPFLFVVFDDATKLVLCSVVVSSVGEEID